MGGFSSLDPASTGSATDVIESVTRTGVKRSDATLSAKRAYPLVLSSNDRLIVAGGISHCCQFGHIDVYRNQEWYPAPKQLQFPRGDACGGFLEGSGGESVVVAGGRMQNGRVLREVEIINPEDVVQTQYMELTDGRYGCVGVTSPDRRSVFVMGGIGGPDPTKPATILITVERIQAAMAQSVLQLPSGARSHMGVVEAPVADSIYAFVLAGNNKSPTVEALPPTRHRPQSAVDILRPDGNGQFETMFSLTLKVARSYPSAVLSVDGVTSYVVIAGGYTQEDSYESQAAGIELIKFESNSPPPTPAPTPPFTPVKKIFIA